MFELLITMLERLGIIVTIAFVVTRFPFFRIMLNRDTLSSQQQFKAMLFFGLFGIIGTYMGLTFNMESLEYNRWVENIADEEAIANSRVIGVVLAGLFGGWRIGLGAGLIAGVHRFTLGGFTSISCGLASVLAGLLAGAFYRKEEHVKLSTAFFIGAMAESIQMLIILVISRPFEQALTLVETIAFPMITANGVGSAMFLLIIRSVFNEEEKAAAFEAQKTLRIARKTLVHLRQGLTPQSAHAVCQILFKEVKADAISITDDSKILAHLGLADDHHFSGQPMQTDSTKKVIQHGNLLVASHEDIQCEQPSCPLGTALIGPLKQGNKTVGTLKFYFRNEKRVTHVNMELMAGLCMLLSYQLEASQVEKAHDLAREAEIKALQAQINPHFLFNTLNTVVSLIRIDPSRARKLLVSLSHFFRKNLAGTTNDWTTLAEEVSHSKAYTAIEETRFVDKLEVDYHLDETILSTRIPPLTLQPLVENCIKHGFKRKTANWKISISIIDKNDVVEVTVKDNGEGIKKARLEQLGTQIIDSSTSTGFGLYNVNRRLMLMVGKEAILKIDSSEGKGTTISFSLPVSN